jgi:D-3-phosphoglycerate dehydrogenase / 2-oxoglutarate reductase
MVRIVVSDCDHKSMEPEEAIFRDSGMAFTHLRCRTEEELIAECAGVNIVLNQYAPFTQKVFAALKPHLGQVVRYGVGVDNIDIAAATAAGVQICNVPDYGVHEVSNHALALILAFERKIVMMNERFHGGTWDYRLAIPIRRMSELTVGIIGFGRIGGTLANKLKPLGCRVVGYDPAYGPGSPKMQDAEWSPFADVISQSDFITVHCPLTPDTYRMFDAKVLGRMKPSAFLINTARGGIIDEDALADALRRGALAGAALDVVEREPLAADSPLRGIESCLITPHMAWYSEEAGLEMKRKVAEEAVRFAHGMPVRYPVNRP